MGGRRREAQISDAAAIDAERVRVLRPGPAAPGPFVVYWMQAAQRAGTNHALEYAVGVSNELRRPLVVLFALTDRYPEANERHYAFLLEGLKETRRRLLERGLPLIVRRGEPDEVVAAFGREAAFVVVDDGYVRHERRWRAAAARALACPFVEVATNVIVPLEAASAKEQYAAATLRPKIYRRLDDFLRPLKETPLRVRSADPGLESFDIENTEAALGCLDIDRAVGRVAATRGGAAEAERKLRAFVGRKLAAYAEDRNDPTLDGQSGLSPYLHFGQISPLAVALAVKKGPAYGQAAFLEELIVRRELSFNFVRRNPAYDRFDGLPEWCRATLLEHAGDERAYAYSRAELERAATHDPYWNAAQKEVVLTGKMHGYMRMYWGKKILEWSASPRQAFRTALALNNAYELDGRGPNAFAGVAWTFGKHDRPWGRRPVYGSVRSMTAAGLRRKFDADAYVRRIEALAGS
ncbi:MAG TPA: deoxyribodipyrimidine photo-lyase [Acidobacteriota bacterium]|nr:deoxyribodipyrimidine photo-lyase [Acidobacteriota bacterium]